MHDEEIGNFLHHLTKFEVMINGIMIARRCGAARKAPLRRLMMDESAANAPHFTHHAGSTALPAPAL